jgi:hypothetical protein
MSTAVCSDAICLERFGKAGGKSRQLGFELVENGLRAIQLGSLSHALEFMGQGMNGSRWTATGPGKFVTQRFIR